MAGSYGTGADPAGDSIVEVARMAGSYAGPSQVVPVGWFTSRRVPSKMAAAPDMSMPSRKACLLILLGVLAGHALLTLHASWHSTAEQQTCKLCTHWSGTHAAPAPALAQTFPRALATLQPVPCVAFPATRLVTDYRPRGPPLAA